jgi:hypothetical protein
MPYSKWVLMCVVGRLLPNSKPLSRGYKTVRFKLWFTKGPLFYFFNLRLFYLYGYKPAALHANDLDTLLPNFLISKWFNIPLVYDSHEFLPVYLSCKTASGFV